MPSKIDPQRIFITGEAFLEVCKVLVAALNAGNRNILALVLATNSALTLETYLKCLLFLQKGSTFGGHDVYKLFKHLPHATQSELSAAHDKFIADNPALKSKWMESTGIELDLESLLKAGRDTFVKFRYAWEEIPSKTNWGLNGFIKCVREYILKLHPEWESAFHNAQSTSLFQ